MTKTIILSDAAFEFLCSHIPADGTDARLVETELGNRELALLDAVATALVAAKEPEAESKRWLITVYDEPGIPSHTEVTEPMVHTAADTLAKELASDDPGDGRTILYPYSVCEASAEDIAEQDNAK